jgi:cyclohexadienyl dehydratase
MARCWSNWPITSQGVPEFELQDHHPRQSALKNRLGHGLAKFCLTGLLILTGTTTFGSPVDPGVVTLYQLVNQRLSHMKNVAAYKWHNQLPIEDLQREQLVIEKATRLAKEVGLEQLASRNFFIAQIIAAKTIQHNWFTAWRQDNTSLPPSPGSLDDEIRPILIRLGNQIIRQVELVLNSGGQLPGQNEIFANLVQTEKLDAESKTKLFHALVQLKLDSPDRQRSRQDILARILESGTVRIGTTGDYAPFSYRSAGRYAGIDIDLGKNLAAEIGVDYQFVSTSWPSLMGDLAADKFDIAMSGISWNGDRQETAYFSISYHQGGKTPITRCEDISRFDELAKIDRGGVKVIVNPGGTNQKFTIDHIRNADVLIFENNTRIFDEIIGGRADVMITDLIEVRLQAKRHPELCASMGTATLSHLEKAYLLPKDDKWKLHVDKWLFKLKQSQTLQQIFADHLDR